MILNSLICKLINVQSSAENERRIQKDEIQDEFISNQLMLEEKEKDTFQMAQEYNSFSKN